KGRALDQRLQRALRHIEAALRVDVLDYWEFGRRQGREGETALAGADHQALLVEADLQLGVIGQRLENVQQLATGDRDVAVLGCIQRNGGNQLDLEIRAGHFQFAALGRE